MSRRYDRTLQVNKKVLGILNDPATIHHLSTLLIRRKPRLMPRFLWKAFLFVVMAPSTRKPVNQ
jgi:hypothetical protein